MKWSAQFPILDLELKRIARRPSTYLVRMLFGISLTLAFVWLSTSTVQGLGGDLEQRLRSLSVGHDFFRILSGLMLGGVAVLLPGSLAGLVAGEREQRTLTLLYLTDLGPGRILAEKFVSRLIPLLSYVALLLPHFAMAFAFGGVGVDSVWGAIHLLALEIALLGSWCLLCSALTPSTLTSVLASYVGALLLAGLLMNWRGSYWPLWGGAVAGFVLTRWALRRSALRRNRRSWAKTGFRKLDLRLKALNRALFGDRYLLKPVRWLPQHQPIRWFETTCGAIGQFRYRLRLGLLYAMGAAVFINACAEGGRRWQRIYMTVSASVWGLTVLTIGTLAAISIGQEKARGTWKVLLTTPMTATDILVQKSARISLHIRILMIPMAMLIAGLLVIPNFGRGGIPQGIFVLLHWYFLCRLTLWWGLLLGAYCRSRARAMSLMLLTMAVVGGFPVIHRFNHGLHELWGILFPSLQGAQLALVPIANLDVVEWMLATGGVAVLGFVVQAGVVRVPDPVLGRCGEGSRPPSIQKSRSKKLAVRGPLAKG